MASLKSLPTSPTKFAVFDFLVIFDLSSISTVYVLQNLHDSSLKKQH